MLMLQNLCDGQGIYDILGFEELWLKSWEAELWLKAKKLKAKKLSWKAEKLSYGWKAEKLHFFDFLVFNSPLPTENVKIWLLCHSDHRNSERSKSSL